MKADALRIGPKIYRLKHLTNISIYDKMVTTILVLSGRINL